MNKLSDWKTALICTLACLPLVAAAQTSAGDPADPKEPTPNTAYQSVFSDYKSFQDSEAAPWRAANDAIAQTDGMAGHEMGNMQETARPQGTEKMPPHDMSNMKGMKNMADTPRMSTEKKSGDMPVHDMKKMKQGAPSAPLKKPGKKPTQPSSKSDSPNSPHAMPPSMPGHSGMQM